jgi:hypothetical protein
VAPSFKLDNSPVPSIALHSKRFAAVVKLLIANYPLVGGYEGTTRTHFDVEYTQDSYIIRLHGAPGSVRRVSGPDCLVIEKDHWTMYRKDIFVVASYQYKP